MEETVTPTAATLTYDAGSRSYQYTLKTAKALAGTCQALELSSHGASTSALFQFR